MPHVIIDVTVPNLLKNGVDKSSGLNNDRKTTVDHAVDLYKIIAFPVINYMRINGFLCY